MWFWPVNRISLRPSLLWLTLNLALIIQCLSQNNTFYFQIYIPLRSLRLPSRVSLPQVEDLFYTMINIYQVKPKLTPWLESASELYRPSDSRLSAKLVPTFADRGVKQNRKFEGQQNSVSPVETLCKPLNL
jgi:hypothetical protein